MQFVETADGSLSLQDTETRELYHNRAGAYTEALLSYVQASGVLKHLERTGQLHLIDACFGLGYNSFVLLAEAIERNIKCSITIDAIDINPELIEALPVVLRYEKFRRLAEKFELQKRVSYGNLNVELRLHNRSLPDQLSTMMATQSPEEDYDLVFHDPFSPNKVPQLWTLDIFQLYQKMLLPKQGAVLTYSAATAVRGAFLDAGFQIARTAIVGKKTGGTIAFIPKTSTQNDFEFFDMEPEEIARLATISAVPYRDPEFGLDRRAIINRRYEEQAQRRKRERQNLEQHKLAD